MSVREESERKWIDAQRKWTANKSKGLFKGLQYPTPKKAAKRITGVKMLSIIYQTSDHEEIHRVESGFGKKLIAEGKFSHTTKNCFRAFNRIMNNLSEADRAEVKSFFTLQL